MDKDKLIKRLMATFLGELEEHVRAINRDLLALEKSPGEEERAGLLRELLRAAHSLKGAARSVNVGLIEEACHRLESVLAALRDGALSPGPDLFALLFATADAIEEAGMRLREETDLAGSPLAALLPRLEAAAEGAPLTPPPPAPTAAPGPPRESAGPAPEPKPRPEPREAPKASEAKGKRPRGGHRPKAPAPPGPPAAPIPEPPAAPAFVRIPAEKLDELLTHSGELLVARRRVESRVGELAALRELVGRWRADWREAERPIEAALSDDGGGPSRAVAASAAPRRAVESIRRAGDRLIRLERDLDRLASAMAGDARQLDRAAGLLDGEVRRARMLPFAEACEGLERAVRDVGLATGKQVDMNINGGDVELDRSILEGLKDPLSHLVRNAVDHGIEPPEHRREAGKPPRGRIEVSAALRGAQVEVVVADDGGGIDPEALRAGAIKRGLPVPAEGRELMNLIFQPGFSTANIITNISGRGVGLDVVKARLEHLHGTIDLDSEVGRGTRFRLIVPLTLTTLRALLVSDGGRIFAFATTNVPKLLRVGPGDFRAVGGRQVLALGGPPLPVASLAETLGLPAREGADAGGKRPGLIVAANERRMAFVVDELLAEQEIVVKGLGSRIRRARHVSGATILPSGRVALVLNAAHLVRTALSRAPGPAPARRVGADAAPEAKRRLLVVEDSVTTRALERSILEAAGYEVETAVDGEAGWRQLQERGADLVITDVEMPRMDGFALTETIRHSDRFARLPVILFTSRASDPDRARGVEVGADAYIVKGAFDQKDLLETIAQLL